MTPATLTWFTIGAVLIYAVVQDPKVYTWLVLQSKVVYLEAERLWYRARYHPDSPWVRYEIKRNSEKLAREMLKEYKNR